MPVEFKLPDLGEGIHEGEIIEVLVKPGDRVEDGQTVLVVETDKAAAEIPSPVTGIVKEIRVKSGQTVRVGEVLMVFLKEGESGEAAPETAEKKQERPAREGKGEAPAGKAGEAAGKTEAERPPAGPLQGPVAAAPSTRRLARELGVDIDKVRPSGPGGRITPEDVRAFAESPGRPAAPKTLPGTEERKPPSPPFEARETPPAAPPRQSLFRGSTNSARSSGLRSARCAGPRRNISPPPGLKFPMSRTRTLRM